MTNDLSPFIVYAPYRAGSEALERRKLFRDEHASGMAKLKETGSLRECNFLIAVTFEKLTRFFQEQVIMHLKPPSEDGTEILDPRELIAATFVIKASSYLEARNIILSDIYWKEDVWNKEQLVINPAMVIS